MGKDTGFGGGGLYGGGGKSGGFDGHVIARCGRCGRVLARSKFAKPKGRNARGKLEVDFCPPGEGCMPASETK